MKNPTVGLELPRPTGKRERIAAPDEAEKLLAALPDEEKALWATAIYAGLRRGELRALRWSHVDLESREIRVRASWDDEEGEVEDKSDAARREVPIIGKSVPILAAEKLRTGRDGGDLVFGLTAEEPFVPSTVRRRALSAWEGLDPLTLHEARHTFASLLIAAGVDAKAIQQYMGHASITMTFDRYGHLMPGSRVESARKVDVYLGDAPALSAV